MSTRIFKRWFADTVERTARTFVQGFLAAVTLDSLTPRFDASTQENLALGAIAGAYAVLSSFAGRATGAPDSASFLPAHVDPPQGDTRE